MLAPSALPSATLSDVQQLLTALLSPSAASSASASELLARLTQQTHAALLDLADDERPTSYEGLLDVARFCVEEEPAWEEKEQAELCEACKEGEYQRQSRTRARAMGRHVVHGVKIREREHESRADGAVWCATRCQWHCSAFRLS